MMLILRYFHWVTLGINNLLAVNVLYNAKTNKEVQSLVNAMRLKPYYDPAD